MKGIVLAGGSATRLYPITKESVSVGQIVSHTGITTKQVRDLSDKNKKKHTN